MYILLLFSYLFLSQPVLSDNSKEKINKQEFQKNYDEAEQEKQNKINLINEENQKINYLLNTLQEKIASEQYELQNNTNFVKETFFQNGSYCVAKFNKKTIYPTEGRLYEKIKTHDNQSVYINTKLTIHNNDGTVDIHTLNLKTGKIISQKMEYFFGISYQSQQKPKKLYTLSLPSLKIKPTRYQKILEDHDEIEEEEEEEELHYTRALFEYLINNCNDKNITIDIVEDNNESQPE